MGVRNKSICPPTDDPRWHTVDGTMLKYGYESHALIEVLHTVQEVFGYLDIKALRYVAAALQVQPSVVYGVATFYHLFSLEPPSKHSCVVCTGTACHIRGADRILEAIDHATGLKADEPCPTHEVSIQTTRCVGFCSPAPVVVFDEQLVGNLNPRLVVEQIRRWTGDAA